MFGHQDDQSTGQDSNEIPEASIHGALEDQAINSNQAGAVASAATAPAADPAGNTDWQHPGVPIDNNQQSTDVISPAGGFPKAPSFPAADPTDLDGHQDPTDNDAGLTDNSSADESTTHELIDIKQHALTELSPLIDQLDQPPEEKFRTIMMMIQASDDQHLVKSAYAAAHSIEDEKVRARALLDIVNEINYFTQQPQN